VVQRLTAEPANAASDELKLVERLTQHPPPVLAELHNLLAHICLSTIDGNRLDLVDEEHIREPPHVAPGHLLDPAAVFGKRGVADSSACGARPSPSRRRSSIAASLDRTSGTGACTCERSPQPLHSTVSQTGFTAEPEASSSDAVSSTFSAAAVASTGLTRAGSILVAVNGSSVVSGSSDDSETTRSTGSL
jgi:hypothetical protein